MSGPAGNGYDVIVIGTGPVGYTVAARARAAGLSVAAVERELVGGECSYWTCIPSKAMLRLVVAVADTRRLRHHRRPDRPDASRAGPPGLAGEHADATLLVNAAGLFVPKPFLDYDGACYDPYAELGHQAIGATPSSAYSLAKGGTAHAHPQPGPRARPPPDPGQRGRAGRRRDPDLREVRPG